ncbi:MAG: dimethyl sulfoxide reductase anchor subunit [Verrucomicrobia bacterium]|nr:dimethyl sulfoxide reductase anchor subunit [Verrucomicrobiota bacterium]
MSTDLVGTPPLSGDRTLIDDLLEEQQLLTPVAKFARSHEQGSPAQAKYYRDLIPLSLPAPGQQYAFAVNLDACTGCKACVTACHNLNGLDAEETWRDVGVLFGGTVAEPVQQTVTTACHHCVDPACMNGCPVNAYHKDSLTGIVRHLDDQCIGCQYCILKCPYDVPKYSKKRGIVRKCDMCSSRLAASEAPACVQACPNEAISITIVNKELITKERRNTNFLPGAPDSSYTLPTTQYHSSRNLPANMTPGDFYNIKPEHSHLPLVVMLVLTQLSVGGFLVGITLRLLFPSDLMDRLAPFHSLVALFLGFLAVGASTMHLGRPLYAWRAFVGLKTSWLSREIVAFGLFAGCALVYAGSFWLPVLSQWVSPPLLRELCSSPLRNALGLGVALSGLGGVVCSIMIYQDTRRTFWRTTMTSLKFVGTLLMLGPATILFTMVCQAAFVPAIATQTSFRQIIMLLCGFIAAISIAKLLCELAVFTHLLDTGWTNMKRTAQLMRGELKHVAVARFVFGAMGGIALPLLGLLGICNLGTAAGILGGSLLGELLERYLFFTAVIPPKMPGGITS